MLIRSIIPAIVVISKGTPLFVKQGFSQTSVQLFLDKQTQVYIRSIVFNAMNHIAVLLQKIIVHQVVFHAPSQIDGYMIVSRDRVYTQLFLFYFLHVVSHIVHHLVNIVV
ncbi:unknown [Prevotella sp. CAG:891]|nr:unknown [Prevotella sp. CAG:891]